MVAVEGLDQTIGDFPQKPAFERGFAAWINEIIAVTKQSNNSKHFSSKLSQIETSLRKNEVYICQQKREKKQNKVKQRKYSGNKTD